MSSRNVYLFVFDSMADWEAAFAISGINNPQFQRAARPVSRRHRRHLQRAGDKHGRRAHPARDHPV